MKLIGILLVLFVGFTACNVVVDGRKLDRHYSEAYAVIQSSVPEALEKFEPCWRISNLRTMGKASKLRKRFTNELIQSALSRLQSSGLDGSDSVNITAVMGAIKDSPILKAQQKSAEQRKILDAIDAARTNVADNGLSHNFESYVGTVKSLNKDPVLLIEFIERGVELEAEAQKVDRYPIALRTAETYAREDLLEGLRRLGLDGSSGTYAMVPMNASIMSWDPGYAEKAFRDAVSTVDHFASHPEWSKRGVSAELHRLAAFGAHNAAMTRVAYTVLTSRNGQQWDWYWVPPIPELTTLDLSIHRANFKADMNKLLGDAAKRGKALINKDPRGKEIARSALYASAIAEARISQHAGSAAKAMQKYKALAPNDTTSGPPARWPPKLVFFF